FDQVGEHLFEPAHVCINHHVSSNLIFQPDTLRRGFSVQRITNILDQLIQINAPGTERHVATLDRSELENVVDESLHARRILTNDRKKTLTTLSIFHRTGFE